MPDYVSTSELNLLTDALRLQIAEQVPIAFNRDARTLMALPKKDSYQSELRFNVDLTPAVSGTRAVTADSSLNAAGDVQQARLSIGDFAFVHGFNILLTSIAQARAAGNAPAVLSNLFQYHVNSGLTQVARNLNARLFSGVGNEASGGVIGFDRIADNTLSYAGFSPVAPAPFYPNWVSTRFKIQDSDLASSTPADPAELTRAAMFRMERLLEEREQTYTHILLSPTNRERYLNLFDESRVIQVNAPGSVSSGDVGIGGLTFNGRPIVSDPQMSNDRIYFIDATQTSVCSMVMDNTVKYAGLNVYVAPVPIQNPLAIRFEIGTLAQLEVMNRRSLGVIDMTPRTTPPATPTPTPTPTPAP